MSINKTLAAYNVCNKWAVVQGKVLKTCLGQEKLLKVTLAATVEWMFIKNHKKMKTMYRKIIGVESIFVLDIFS